MERFGTQEETDDCMESQNVFLAGRRPLHLLVRPPRTVLVTNYLSMLESGPYV
jgi:hypothetical protein